MELGGLQVTLMGMLILMGQQTLDRQKRDKQIDEERKLWEESLNKECDKAEGREKRDHKEKENAEERAKKDKEEIFNNN